MTLDDAYSNATKAIIQGTSLAGMTLAEKKRYLTLVRAFVNGGLQELRLQKREVERRRAAKEETS